MLSLGRSLASLFLVSTLLCSAMAFALEEQTQPLFAGLFINDEELDGADLYHIEDDYWLPLDQLASWTNIEVVQGERTTRIDTPLGSAEISSDSLRELPEGTHINMQALADIGVQASFEQSAYALVIYAPWIGLKPASAALVLGPQSPDYLPPKIGVSRLYNRFETSYENDVLNTGLYSDAMGYLSNGAWGLQTATDAEQETKLNQLYWHTFNRYLAVRIGTAQANPGPLLDTPEYSGLQLGYSNLSVYNHLAASTSVSRQMFVDDASYSHDISGTGPKGGIAELRLNDRPIARVRIALDGKFLFTRLPITQGNTDRVEVALYEYSLAQPPIQVIDYTTARKPRAVSTGELMLHAGIGAPGSNLEDSTEIGETTSYGSLRYGLSNFLTIEAATQQQTDRDNGWYLGFIGSFGSHFATNFGLARSAEKNNVGAELWATWPTFKTSYRGNREQDEAEQTISQNHELSVRWDASDNFSLLARGLFKEDDDIVSDKYLAPGFDWKITPYSSLSVQPTDGEDYNARLSLRSEENGVNLQLRSSNSGSGLGIQYATNDAFSLGADYGTRDDQRVISVAAQFRPRHNNDSVFSAQLSQQTDTMGYSLGWRHRLSPRTQFNINYRRQLEDTDAVLETLTLDNSESVNVSLESELWFGSGWKSNGTRTDSTHGALRARLTDSEGQILDSDRIRLQVDGTRSKLHPGGDGEQSLSGLPPGDYNLKLLADGLPIEYENSASNYRVRVAPAATTQVDITLKAHYGVSGLLTLNGEPAAHTWVDIWQDEQRVATSKTDGYGYYQVTALEPGEYEVRYDDNSKSFEVVDDFLFDINLASGMSMPQTAALAKVEHTLDEYKVVAQQVVHQKEESPIAVEAQAAASEIQLDFGSKLPLGLGGRTYYQDEAVGHVSVALLQRDQVIATVISDRYGYFSFHHLSEGDYRVGAGSSTTSVKLGNHRSYDADIHIKENSIANNRWSKP